MINKDGTIKVARRAYYPKSWAICVRRNKVHYAVLAEALGITVEELFARGAADEKKRAIIKDAKKAMISAA